MKNKKTIPSYLVRQLALQRRLAAVLLSHGQLSKKDADSAAFHLADWHDDLRNLVRWYDGRSKGSQRGMAVITNFLVHAPNHLAAAHRIVFGDPLIDVFGIGAVQGTGRPKKVHNGLAVSASSKKRKRARSRRVH